MVLYAVNNILNYELVGGIMVAIVIMIVW